MSYKIDLAIKNIQYINLIQKSKSEIIEINNTTIINNIIYNIIIQFTLAAPYN